MAEQARAAHAAADGQGTPDEQASADPAATRRATYFIVGFIILAALLLFGWLLLQRWQGQRAVDTNRYNGFDFAQFRDGNVTLWRTRVQVGDQPYDIPFYYHPRDTERVVLEPGLTDRFLDPKRRPTMVYASLSPDAGSTPVIAGVELVRILGYRYGLLNIDTRSAFQEQPEGNTTEYVVKTCADATNGTTVILFELGQDDIVVADRTRPGCIHLRYTSPQESIRVADRFAYGLLRIMPG